MVRKNRTKCQLEVGFKRNRSVLHSRASLARTFGKRFGDEAYAMEELVAELGSAFLCGDLGLSVTPRPDHACYLASWLKVLKQDSRAVITAAAKAQAVADYLRQFSSSTG